MCSQLNFDPERSTCSFVLRQAEIQELNNHNVELARSLTALESNLVTVVEQLHQRVNILEAQRQDPLKDQHESLRESIRTVQVRSNHFLQSRGS